jgi:macrolide-specific efflux system membrane fusion protein
MRKQAVWIAVVVFALGLSIGFYFNRSQEVQTSKAVTHEFTTFIEGAGAVNAPTEVVAAPANGIVKSVPVQVGQRVSAGDAVLIMDDEELKLQLEAAVLALNAQKKAYDRQNGELTRSQQEAAMMAAQTAGYGLEQFNSAQTEPIAEVGAEQVELARVQVRQAQAALERATVTSALDGIVLDVGVRAGETVAAGMQALVIASMDDAAVDSIFADLDASSIRPGMEVQFYGGCLGQAACEGVVTEIKPKAETLQTQTGSKSSAVVKIRPIGSNPFDRLGASVELKVVTGRKVSVGVPIEALAQDNSGLYVFVVRRGRAYRTPVEVGVLDEYYAEVTSGVRQGDVVALNPTELRNGQKVSAS